MRRWRCGVIGPMMYMDLRSTVGTGASNALPTSRMVLVAPTMPLLWSLPLREALEQPLHSVHYSPPCSPTLYLFSFVHEVRKEAIQSGRGMQPTASQRSYAALAACSRTSPWC